MHSCAFKNLLCLYIIRGTIHPNICPICPTTADQEKKTPTTYLYTPFSKKHLSLTRPYFLYPQEILKQIFLFEEVIAQFLSLQAKFLPQKSEEETLHHTDTLQQFVCDLMDKPEVPVVGAGIGVVGETIQRLFGAAQRVGYVTANHNSVCPLRL